MGDLRITPQFFVVECVTVTHGVEKGGSEIHIWLFLIYIIDILIQLQLIIEFLS